MSLVPLQHRVELYLGGVWVDVSAWLLDHPVPHQGGYGDEAKRLLPATFSFDLNNLDGRFTPGNPVSPLYPYLQPDPVNGTINVPVRWSIAAAANSLFLPGTAGARAGTPDDASLDVTGDWFLGVEIEPPLGIPTGGLNYELFGKFNTVGNQRSIVLSVNPAGLLFLRWSTDGTAAGQHDGLSSIPIPQRLWSTRAFAAGLDVNNGAGGHNVHFYAADTLAAILAAPTASEFGAVFTGVGTTSVFSSTSPLDLGDVTGSGFQPYQGKVRRAQARSGDATGTIVANPDFTAQALGATSFVDSAGRTWSVNSPAAIEQWQTRHLGEIVSIEPDYTEGDPGLPTVRFTAAGVTRRLQQRDKALRSPLTRKALSPTFADRLTAHWPWEDGTDSTQAASTVPGIPPIQVAGFRFHGDDSLPATDGMANISGGQGGGWAVRVPVGSTTDWSVHWLVNLPQMDAATYGLHLITTTGRVHQWIIQANSTQVTITGFDAAGGGVVLTTFPWDTRFQVASLLRLHANVNGGNTDWKMEWIPLQGSAAGVSFGPGTLSYAGAPGRVSALANLLAAPPGGMSVGQFSVTTNTPDGWLAPADQAYAGETAATRFARICQEEQIPVVVEGDVADSARMGPQPIDTILAILEDCARTDGGIQVELRHDVGVGLRTLASMYNQDPAITFDIANGDLGLPFQPKVDDQRVLNDVTAVRNRGSSYRATTIPAPPTDKTYDGEVQTNVESDGLLLDVAFWALHLGTSPEMRYPAITSDLVPRPALVDAWVHSGPGDILQVVGVPDHPDPLILLREGGGETAGTTSWEIEATSTPGLLYEVGVRDDTARGRRDSGDSTLTATFVAGTDTTMTVAVASGLLWTTAGGDFPFEVDVGGARITVTAISGASSPQTFTVSTTVVNGVAKTVPSGTAVKLWRPTVRAR